MNTLLNSINFGTIAFWLLALIGGFFLQPSVNKCKEEGHPRLCIFVWFVSLFLSMGISYIIQAGYMNLATITITLLVFTVIGIRFFGSFWGTFGIFVPSMAVGWFFGEIILKHSLNGFAIAMTLLAIGIAIQSQSRKRK